MPFFFILPLWLFAVLVGGAMVCIRSVRGVGVYVLTMSTLALLVSFALFYAVLLGLASIAPQPGGWFGFVVVGWVLRSNPSRRSDRSRCRSSPDAQAPQKGAQLS